MFNFIHKKYHYFIVCKVDTSEKKDNLVGAAVYKFLKRYFFWRGRSVKYFEPFISTETHDTFAVFGTAKGEKTVNRNCLIFLLELYASLTNPSQFTISHDFTRTTKSIGAIEVTIYRVKK